MDYKSIAKELSKNQLIYEQLFSNLTHEQYLWKQSSDKWCLLEILCHLYDEEREDFRARVKHTLDTPKEQMPPIDPVGWIKERKYMEQNYDQVLKQFMDERAQSVDWLNSLNNSNWDNVYSHPTFGDLTPKMFLANWLAHDYLHIKQILKLKFDYTQESSGESFEYAGGW